MFTGLIEEQGKIKSIKITSAGMELTIECSKILSDVKEGASICINGACQSVTSFGKDYITVQTSNETLNVTNFRKLQVGEMVNLERALTLNSRLDGHIVSGHIDCTAEFVNSKEDGFCNKLFFKLPDSYTKYVIYKGSIAINGVSLTIANIDNNIFTVELIPDTLKKVNLSKLKKGDIVNIETDLFAKYIEKIYNSNNTKSNITYGFLAENGFV
ncbi:riboflavin synthase [bacterium]|nr:riboflavin synthase [bacterium]